MTQTSTGTPKATKAQLSRKTLKWQFRQKRKKRLQSDKEFAKAFFEAKSKRSTEKKSTFRKKKKGKK